MNKSNQFERKPQKEKEKNTFISQKGKEKDETLQYHTHTQ